MLFHQTFSGNVAAVFSISESQAKADTATCTVRRASAEFSPCADKNSPDSLELLFVMIVMTCRGLVRMIASQHQIGENDQTAQHYARVVGT